MCHESSEKNVILTGVTGSYLFGRIVSWYTE